MTPSITKRFRAAVRFAAASVADIAAEAGYSRITFDVYLNRQPPTRAAAMGLAEALEGRATKLLELAAGLREAVGEAGDPSPRPGR